MAIDRLLARLVPPGGTDEEHQWRWAVAVSLGGLIFVTAGAAGAFTWAGISAHANEGEVTRQVHKLENRLTAIEDTQRIAARLVIAGEICRLHYLRMGTSGALRLQLNTSYEEKQNEYFRIAGSRYPINECTPPG